MVLITSLKEIDRLARSVRSSAERTVNSMRLLLANEPDSLHVLRLMKFSEIGHHPTEDRKLNIIEQLNQTFTYLVSLEAARWELVRHPELLPSGLKVNLGTAPGFDLESVQTGHLAVKVFAATHPASNNKLRLDLKRLSEKAADVKNRYVFFSCPGFTNGRQEKLETVPGVEVWSFSSEVLLKGAN